MSTRFPEYPFDNPRYPLPRLSVEVAVMTVRDGELQVLMVPRSENPRDGRLVLPGTFDTARSGHKVLPLGQGGRAANLVSLTVDEMTFLIEVIVNGAVH